VISRELGETVFTVHVRMPTAAMGQVHQSAKAIRPAGEQNADSMAAPVSEADLPVSETDLPNKDASSEVA